VPGTASIAFAGQPSGKSLVGIWAGCGTDSTPANSPVEIQIPSALARVVQFAAPTGTISTSFEAIWRDVSPDGRVDSMIPSAGILGLSRLVAPNGSLVGVFLGSGSPVPDPVPRPPELDFRGGLRELDVLEPLLQQPFLVGGGRTTTGLVRSYVVPQGATRLFLAVNDHSGCSSANTGSFAVTVITLTPEEVRVFNPIWSGDTFSASFVSKNDRSYGLEYKNALSNAAWTKLPLRTGRSGVTTLRDFPLSGNQRLYRVRAE